MNQIHSVCVYSASSTKINPVYFKAAEELGSLLAEHHIRLINGAGSIGLMCAVADAVLKNGGEVTGVIPRFMVEQNWHHTGLTELIEVESMHERKQKMANLSDGIVALPGGCGTLEELLEIITWKQLGLYLNPIVILNVNGFFDPLLEMLGNTTDGQEDTGNGKSISCESQKTDQVYLCIAGTALFSLSMQASSCCAEEKRLMPSK